MHQIFWRFLRHIETFLDHLGNVDTTVGRVPVPKLGHVEQMHRGVGSSISQLLLGPHAPNFLEVPKTHGNISRLLGSVDTSMSGAPVPKNWAKLSKYMGEWGGQHLSFY